MKTIVPGHIYQLDLLDKDEGLTPTTPASIDSDLLCDVHWQELMVFVQRGIDGSNRHAGYTCQEVLRVLIDRVKVLDDQQPWSGNKDILNYLRSALLLFEHRAAMKHVWSGQLWPEYTPVGEDGHFVHGVKDK